MSLSSLGSAPALQIPDDTPDSDRLISSRTVARYFDVSIRTVDRYLQRPDLGFPQPAMIIPDAKGRPARRLWKVSDVLKWQRAREGAR
jgi:hypothetical protein